VTGEAFKPTRVCRKKIRLHAQNNLAIASLYKLRGWHLIKAAGLRLLPLWRRVPLEEAEAPPNGVMCFRRWNRRIVLKILMNKTSEYSYKSVLILGEHP
jgi:hypothetical protein